MASYSFLDVTASMAGPTGSFELGAGAAVAEEGITIDFVDDKGSMIIGADGEGMHSLHGGKGANITVRLLQTSPTNAQLAQAYSAQAASAAVWGQNTIIIRNPVSGDIITCRQVAFRKLPASNFAKTGSMREWTFMSIKTDVVYGSGSPTAD